MLAPGGKPLSIRAGFLAAVRASGLLTPDKYREAMTKVPTTARTGRAVATALIAAGALTRFQVERLLVGRPGGFVLGQYVIQDQIARGPGGRIYKALHRAMNRPVAIRVLPADPNRDHAALLAEVHSAARLTHPNVLTILDADRHRGRFFVVREHVEGEAAGAAVKRSGPLVVSRACEIVRQAALGLQHAHERGVCHGSLTPGSLLVGRPAIKVTDFGLGRMGGADYLAPELFAPEATPTPRSDLYALGGVLYYLLTGRTPFPALSAADQARHHRESEPVPVEVLRPDVPPAVAALIRELLSKEPSQRPAAAGEVSARLDPYGEFTGTVTTGECYQLDERDALLPPSRPPGTLVDSVAGSTLAGDSLAELSPWSGFLPAPIEPTKVNRTGLVVTLAVGAALILAAVVALLVAL